MVAPLLMFYNFITNYCIHDRIFHQLITRSFTCTTWWISNKYLVRFLNLQHTIFFTIVLTCLFFLTVHVIFKWIYLELFPSLVIGENICPGMMMKGFQSSLFQMFCSYHDNEKELLKKSNFVVQQKLRAQHLSISELREKKTKCWQFNSYKKIIYFGISLCDTSKYLERRAK